MPRIDWTTFWMDVLADIQEAVAERSAPAMPEPQPFIPKDCAEAGRYARQETLREQAMANPDPHSNAASEAPLDVQQPDFLRTRICPICRENILNHTHSLYEWDAYHEQGKRANPEPRDDGPNYPQAEEPEDDGAWPPLRGTKRFETFQKADKWLSNFYATNNMGRTKMVMSLIEKAERNA